MKTICSNPKVSFDYFIEDTIPTGMVLEGWEVKAILSNKISIKESHVKLINGELFLVGSSIEPGHVPAFITPDRTRFRKLLVTSRQRNKLIGLVQRSGYTLMVSDIFYSDTRKIKATLCLCKGKKKYDKREAIKERDIQRRELRHVDI